MPDQRAMTVNDLQYETNDDRFGVCLKVYVLTHKYNGIT